MTKCSSKNWICGSEAWLHISSAKQLDKHPMPGPYTPFLLILKTWSGSQEYGLYRALKPSGDVDLLAEQRGLQCEWWSAVPGLHLAVFTHSRHVYRIHHVPDTTRIIYCWIPIMYQALYGFALQHPCKVGLLPFDRK